MPRLRDVLLSRLPSDPAAESAVLGEMVAHKHAGEWGVVELRGEDFYDPRNRAIFGLLCAVLPGCPEPAPALLWGEAQAKGVSRDVGGQAYLEAVATDSTGYMAVERFARILRARRADRESILKGIELVEAGLCGRGAGLPSNTNAASLSTLSATVDAEKAGTRYAVEWPWPEVNRFNALLPGTVTMICGAPGASKSLLVLEAIWRMAAAGESVAILELEESPEFHFRRFMAQAVGDASILNAGWVKANPSLYDSMVAAHADLISLVEGRAVIQAPPSGIKVDTEYVLRWLASQAGSGRRVLAVDPLAMIETGEKIYLDHERIARESAKLAERENVSIIFVCHPKASQGPPRPDIENIQGAKALGRIPQTILWLASHPLIESQVRVSAGSAVVEHNRTLHALKVRLGPGQWDQVAMNLDGKSLTHKSAGVVA